MAIFYQYKLIEHNPIKFCGVEKTPPWPSDSADFENRLACFSAIPRQNLEANSRCSHKRGKKRKGVRFSDGISLFVGTAIQCLPLHVHIRRLGTQMSSAL